MPIEPVAAAAPDTPWKRRIGGLAAVAALGLSALAGCSDDEPPADTGGDGGGVETDTGGDTGGSIPGNEPGDTSDEGADDGLNNDPAAEGDTEDRSEEHTSELQSLMRNSYAVFCLKK